MAEYYDSKDLGRFGDMAAGAPELYEKFRAWYDEGVGGGSGALSAREKALIALGVAHALQCPYCIDAFTTRSLESGADLEQMTEAVHVASALRAGASLVHGVQMLGKHDAVSM
ncbi:MAG: arsenosugar biosynthesis-associated peroxidase-like protein [Planctomycetota bacterium]